MGSNNGANKGMHYSHREEFWSRRYDKIKMALADDELALSRFTSEVKDLDSFKVCWMMSGGSLDRIAKAFRYLVSTEKTPAEPKKTPAEPEKTIKMENIKETRARRGSGCSTPFRLVDAYTGEVLAQYGELDDGAYWGSTNGYGK